MKNMKLIPLQFILLMLLFSCSSEDDSPSPENSTVVADAVRSGTWRITYFWDTDKEETNHYLGYSFTFAQNGDLIATNGSNTYNGSWNTGTDDSQVKLIINFSAPEDFVEISDDWHVLEQTASKIRLEDVSGGNGGTDLLTFEKN
jgi:hypothetical protein